MNFFKIYFWGILISLLMIYGCQKEMLNVEADEILKLQSQEIPSATVDDEISIPNEADAYVEDGNSKDKNFGTLSYLIAKDDGENYRRECYIRFDLNGLSGKSMEDVRVELAGGVVQLEQVQNAKWVYYLVENNWDENTISWNNVPKEIVKLGEVDGKLSKENEVIRFHLPSNLLQEAYQSSDTRISIKIIAQRKDLNGVKFYSDFSSREEPRLAFRPALKFKYLHNQTHYYKNLVMDKITFDGIQLDLKNSQEAVNLIGKEVTAKANEALKKRYTSVAKLQAISEIDPSASAIYCLGLQYFLFQEQPNAQQYVDKAVEILLEWANLNKPSDHTPTESGFLNFFYGYSLIREKVSYTNRSKIDNWLDSRFRYYSKLSVRTNNWETIRNSLMMSIGYVLNNEDFVNQSIKDFTKHHNTNYRADGASIDFLGRDGFAYHVYDMLFIAQIGRFMYINKGRDYIDEFVNHRSRQWVNLRINAKDSPVLGGSLGDAVDFIAPYVLDPDNYKHVEFVNTEWAPDKSRGDYNKPYNAIGSQYVFVEAAALMKNEMFAFLQKIQPSFNRFTNLTYYLNSFGPSYNNFNDHKVTLYGDIPFRGWYKELGAGSYQLNDLKALGVVDNALSSISIPKGYRVILYDNDNFTGESVILTSHILDLGKFDNRTSSLKIERSN